MRIRTAVALALALTWLGCSKPESEAPKDAAPPAPAATRAPAAADAPAPTASPKRPAVTLPTVHVEPPADIPPDPRRAETPCDRHEAGWKWHGTVIEDGRCVVGPCTCVKE